MTDDDLRRLALGCFLPGFTGQTPPRWLLDGIDAGVAGLILFGSNLGDGTKVAALTSKLRAAAGRELVFGLDEEGGDVTRLDTVRGSSSPGAAALGWLDDIAATEAAYAAIGARLVEAGVTLNLAPVADVNVDPQNPVIGVRSFSADPIVAGRHVAAAVRGIQRAGVAACVKHFPGHGATRSDSHHEVAMLDRSVAELQAVEFPPFAAGIAAGTRAVMTGHLLVPALDSELATVSAAITTGLLRDALGFDGTIVTDALEMTAVSGSIGMVEGFVRALIAGADAIESGALDYPSLLSEIPDAVLQAVHAGRLSVERLTDAARRTALLAAAGVPLAAVDLSGIAPRCVEVVGTLPTVVGPLVVECRPPAGMASGALPWSLAEPLSQLVPGTSALAATGPVDIAELLAGTAGRSVILVVRDPDRHRWQRTLMDALAGHPGTVLVEVGWPTESTVDLPLVRTRGVSSTLLGAAATMLAG